MGLFKALKQIDKALIAKIGVINARRFGRLLVGIIPTLGTFIFTLHCGILLLGYHSHLAGFLFKYALLWFILLTILSIAFEFCWVHRSFLLYNYIIGVCIEHQINYGFGDALLPARWIALGIGVFLIVAFIKNNCWREFFEHTKNN